jgi:hypothetical protein
MKFKIILFSSISILIFSSICLAQKGRRHIINDIDDMIYYKSSSDNVPTFSYLGSVTPLHASIIKNVYISDQDSLMKIYLDLVNYDQDSLRFIELVFNSNISQHVVFVDANMKKNIPDKILSIIFHQNKINKKYDKYPYKHEWAISDEVLIKCTTYRGCIDTDRAVLDFFYKGTHVLAQSNLGWTTLFEVDINKNSLSDFIIISNKICELKLEFYLVIF